MNYRTLRELPPELREMLGQAVLIDAPERQLNRAERRRRIREQRRERQRRRERFGQ